MADNTILTGFDADNFRDKIRQTMLMGLPNVSADKPTFYFREVKTWPAGTVTDTEGSPLDPRIQPTITSPEPVQVPCAVEFKTTRNDDEGLAGSFHDTAATLTILDVDWELIKDAIEVTLNGERYYISYESPVIALGPVDVHTVHVFPVQEAR